MWTERLDAWYERLDAWYAAKDPEVPMHFDGTPCPLSECSENHHYCDQTMCDCAMINTD